MLTVTTPATSYDLTTLAAVKAELGVAGNAEDARLSAYIKQASDAVTAYCNATFAQETLTETLRLDWRKDILILSRNPVTSIASVTENATALASTDYEFDADNGTVHRLMNDAANQWPQGKIVFVYTAGYILPGSPNRTLPNDIERAAILLVARYYSADPQSQLTRRETIEGIGSSELFQLGPSGLPPEVTALLQNYRNPAIW